MRNFESQYFTPFNDFCFTFSPFNVRAQATKSSTCSFKDYFIISLIEISIKEFARQSMNYSFLDLSTTRSVRLDPLINVFISFIFVSLNRLFSAACSIF